MSVLLFNGEHNYRPQNPEVERRNERAKESTIPLLSLQHFQGRHGRQKSKAEDTSGNIAPTPVEDEQQRDVRETSPEAN